MDMTTIEDLLKRLATYPLALGTVTLSVAAVGYICVKGVYGNEKKPFEYPPGPPQDLLIGNLKQFPKGSISEGFCRWARQYGWHHFFVRSSRLMKYRVDRLRHITGKANCDFELV